MLTKLIKFVVVDISMYVNFNMNAVRSPILPLPKSMLPKLEQTGISIVNYFTVDPNGCALKAILH